MEVLAGITAFFSMMYVIVVTPLILNSMCMLFGVVFTAIVIFAFSFIMIELYTKNPIVLAPCIEQFITLIRTVK